MNRIFGIYTLQSNVDPSLIDKTQFKSPLWEPDHIQHHYAPTILLTTTQRYITPECHTAPMPYQNGGCFIICDAFLTRRYNLCQRLNLPTSTADAALILAAYLKWGSDCTRYLSGEFCFAIWDPKQSIVFLATDPFNKRPLLYCYQPGKFLAFANEMSPFRAVCPTLTVNENLFAYFALDSIPAGETCYTEVLKLEPGHQLLFKNRTIQLTCYWRLRDQRERLPYRKRDDYYAAFQTLFRETVSDYLRSSHAIASHISGGLDSSSVAAQAAQLLAEKSKPLYGFTAIPKELEGPSYRKGWYYHEMPLVDTLLEQYANIRHTVYRSNPEQDIFQTLKQYYNHIDQPIRNVTNFEWLIAGLEHARQNNSRIILTGERGNGSISWPGLTIRQRLSHWKNNLQIFLKPQSAFNGLFNHCQPSFLTSKLARSIIRERAAPFSGRDYLLSSRISARRQSSLYPISLYHGVLQMDPTHDLALVEFCYNVPNWVYCRGKRPLEKRLLVRDGLTNILPTPIRLNPFRGEQAADWFLQYNLYALSWFLQLEILHKNTTHLLNKYYKTNALLNYKCDQANINQAEINLYLILIRYIGTALFLNEKNLRIYE